MKAYVAIVAWLHRLYIYGLTAEANLPYLRTESSRILPPGTCSAALSLIGLLFVDLRQRIAGGKRADRLPAS